MHLEVKAWALKVVHQQFVKESHDPSGHAYENHLHNKKQECIVRKGKQFLMETWNGFLNSIPHT